MHWRADAMGAKYLKRTSFGTRGSQVQILPLRPALSTVRKIDPDSFPDRYAPVVWLLSSPALSKRRHRSLARRLVAVSRRAVLLVAVGQRPHLWRVHGRGGSVEDAADHDAIDKQVKIAPPRGHCCVRQNVSPVRKTSIA